MCAHNDAKSYGVDSEAIENTGIENPNLNQCNHYAAVGPSERSYPLIKVEISESVAKSISTTGTTTSLTGDPVCVPGVTIEELVYVGKQTST